MFVCVVCVCLYVCVCSMCVYVCMCMFIYVCDVCVMWYVCMCMFIYVCVWCVRLYVCLCEMCVCLCEICMCVCVFKCFQTTLRPNSGFKAPRSRTPAHCRPRDYTPSATLPRDSVSSVIGWSLTNHKLVFTVWGRGTSRVIVGGPTCLAREETHSFPVHCQPRQEVVWNLSSIPQNTPPIVP